MSLGVEIATATPMLIPQNGPFIEQAGIEVQKEKPKKIQISTYIDDDVQKLLEKFGKQHGKGAKSNLINELLRNALQ